MIVRIAYKKQELSEIFDVSGCKRFYCEGHSHAIMKG